ncbi:hypothetical protein NLX74_19645 [Paenibacillus sp. MZ03-122A]|nr:hypothetical protein [Paenibacillus sp. MZ03-122A]
MDDLVHSDITDLDTLVNMIKLSFSFADGANMIALCDRLYSHVNQKYQELQLYKARKKPIQPIHTKRPLVYYYGYSHLMKGMAFQKQGKYEAARDCIEKYAELGWFNDLDQNMGKQRLNITAMLPELICMPLIFCQAMPKCCRNTCNFFVTIRKSCYRGFFLSLRERRDMTIL